MELSEISKNDDRNRAKNFDISHDCVQAMVRMDRGVSAKQRTERVAEVISFTLLTNIDFEYS